MQTNIFEFGWDDPSLVIVADEIIKLTSHFRSRLEKKGLTISLVIFKLLKNEVFGSNYLRGKKGAKKDAARGQSTSKCLTGAIESHRTGQAHSA
jgi:hypothetical protein